MNLDTEPGDPSLTGAGERRWGLNVLANTVAALVPICEDMVEVEQRHGVERLLARITRRSQETLGLAPGERCLR